MRLVGFVALIAGLTIACGDIKNNEDAGPDVDAGPSADGNANLPPDAGMPEGDGGVSDVTPPETTIDQAPGSPINETSTSIEFSSNESGTFRCRVDGQSWVNCTSPHTFTVGEGSHTFDVFAIDDASNPDLTPASHSWLVDTTAPVVTISSGPSNPTSSAAANFEFSSNESGTLECRLDGGAFSACTSPSSYSGIADGSHTFEVRSTDAAGNTGSASYSWSRDGAAPTIVITQGPDNPTNSTSASFVFQAEAGATVQCRIDGGAFGSCATATTMSYSGLSSSTHTFEVRATDPANNSAVAQYSWSIDTAPPVVSIIQRPSNPTASTSANFTFNANESVTWQCRMNSGPWGACTGNGSTSYNGLAGNTTHTFHVRGTDAAGNVGSSSYSWSIDTQPPTTTIQQKPSSSHPVNYVNFTWTSNDSNATYECSLDGGSWVACTSPRSYTGLTYAAHGFRVRATDALGNTETSYPSHNWTSSPGLLLYYKFDDDLRNGSALGADHDGQAADINFVTGKFGKAVQFTAEPSSYMKVPDTLRPLTSHYNFTFSMWVFEPGLDPGNQERALFDFADNAGGAGGGFKVYRQSSEDLELFVDWESKSGASGGGVVNLGIKVWHHLIFEHRPAGPGVGAGIAVYIDGRLSGVIKNPNEDEIFSAYQLSSMLLGTNSYFVIDEFRVYNRIFDDKDKCTQLILGEWVTGQNYCQLP